MSFIVNSRHVATHPAHSDATATRHIIAETATNCAAAFCDALQQNAANMRDARRPHLTRSPQMAISRIVLNGVCDALTAQRPPPAYRSVRQYLPSVHVAGAQARRAHISTNASPFGLAAAAGAARAPASSFSSRSATGSTAHSPPACSSKRRSWPRWLGAALCGIGVGLRAAGAGCSWPLVLGCALLGAGGFLLVVRLVCAAAQRLARPRDVGARMPDLHSFVDTENVMHAQRMSQADEAVARFAATVPLSPQEGPEMLAEVADYLISRAPDSTAMRALDVYDGYSRPLRRDSEASELIARIWKFSQLPQMSRQERSNVQHSLMHAMAQCREVDGHRVCSTGVRQRLIAVVRGYTPLPEELPVPAQVVTSLTEKLHNETAGDPSTKQLRDFCAEALRHAQYVYRDTPRYIEEFRGSLRNSVQTLYDFEMGTI